MTTEWGLWARRRGRYRGIFVCEASDFAELGFSDEGSPEEEVGTGGVFPQTIHEIEDCFDAVTFVSLAFIIVIWVGGNEIYLSSQAAQTLSGAKPGICMSALSRSHISWTHLAHFHRARSLQVTF